MLFIYIVPQANAYTIERLGVYTKTWNAGLHFCIPFIDKVSRKMSLKEQISDFPPLPVITKDNCTVLVDTVVFFQICDPKLFTYGVASPIAAIENSTATTLRIYIGQLSLEEVMVSREDINSHMRSDLDRATEPWGIKVNRVEIKKIKPPEDVISSMEKQIKAERDKRATIANAEASKQSAILIAQGKQEATVLNAEAAKKAQILAAEADKESKILKAQGEKEQRILKAEGEAQAILKIQEARAKGIKMISESNPSDKYIDLQKLDTLAKVGNGRATKIIIPSELQSLSGLALSLKETLTDKVDDENEENILNLEKPKNGDFTEVGEISEEDF